MAESERAGNESSLERVTFMILSVHGWHRVDNAGLHQVGILVALGIEAFCSNILPATTAPSWPAFSAI